MWRARTAAWTMSGDAGFQLIGVLLVAVMACTLLLTLGSELSYPFEMDTVVGLSAGRLIATHYGLYNTIAGIGRRGWRSRR